MIELRHLRYFIVVAEELHFGRAAERLHMAQSPLSHQMLQLERQLGVTLIDRRHNVTGLTDAGRSFEEAARRILADVDHAVALARRAARGEVGTLRVGYVNEITADLLPLALNAFKRQCPDIEIELFEGITGHLLDELRDSRLDVVFVRSPQFLHDLHYHELLRERLVVAYPSALAVPHSGGLPALAGAGFVVPSHAAARGLRLDIDAACRSAGFEPVVARQADSVTAVMLQVAAGAGIALIPASVANLYPVPGVDFAELAPPVPTTSAGLAWRQDSTSRVLHRFRHVVTGVADRRSHPSADGALAAEVPPGGKARSVAAAPATSPG